MERESETRSDRKLGARRIEIEPAPEQVVSVLEKITQVVTLGAEWRHVH